VNRRRRESPRQPRLDYTQIALLEWELFGIRPKSGTTAAAIIGMRHLQQMLAEPSFAEQYANPRLIGPAH
jgi:hypothetical protein